MIYDAICTLFVAKKSSFEVDLAIILVSYSCQTYINTRKSIKLCLYIHIYLSDVSVYICTYKKSCTSISIFIPVYI